MACSVTWTRLLTNILLLRKLMTMNTKSFPLPRNMMMPMPMDMFCRVAAAQGLC
jgi:hypothetical protein